MVIRRSLLRCFVLIAATFPLFSCAHDPLLSAKNNLDDPPTCLIEGPFVSKHGKNFPVASRASGGVTYNLLATEIKYLRPFPLGRILPDPTTRIESGPAMLDIFQTPDPLSFVRHKFSKASRLFNVDLPDPYLHQFPIDSTVSKLWIKVDATSPTIVQLSSSTGKIITQKISDEQYIQDYQQACIISVNMPEIGYWTLSMQSENPVLATIKVRSPLRFTDFAFVKEDFTRHGDNFFVHDKKPIEKKPTFAQATFLGEINHHLSHLTFTTRTIDEKIIQQFDVSQRNGNIYRIEGIIPSFEEQYIEVTGRDPQGYPFQRRYSNSIEIFEYTTPPEETPYESPYPEDHFRK